MKFKQLHPELVKEMTEIELMSVGLSPTIPIGGQELPDTEDENNPKRTIL